MPAARARASPSRARPNGVRAPLPLALGSAGAHPPRGLKQHRRERSINEVEKRGLGVPARERRINAARCCQSGVSLGLLRWSSHLASEPLSPSVREEGGKGGRDSHLRSARRAAMVAGTPSRAAPWRAVSPESSRASGLQSGWLIRAATQLAWPLWLATWRAVCARMERPRVNADGSDSDGCRKCHPPSPALPLPAGRPPQRATGR